ncbi:hypothetical protein Tco_1456664 [Tanacetum coccineum]
MSASNQQTLAESGATDRPPVLEKGNYIPWESQFRMFLENKGKTGSKCANKKRYTADVRVMNYILQAIPNDIYNLVDAYKDSQKMWGRIRWLMYGYEVNKHMIHSRLMNEFDKFEAKDGESLEFVYEMLSTLVNVMDCNDARPVKVSVNTKFLNSLQPENQAVIHDGRVDIQTKNTGYGGNGNRNAGRQNRNQAVNARNGHYARDCPKPKVRDAKYFKEQMMLAMKDEAGGTLNDEENHFMLDNAYGDETLEKLTTVRLLISGMISKGVHENTNHEKLKTVINTSDDDQIDSNIIFDDPYVENNGRTVKHASNAHD